MNASSPLHQPEWDLLLSAAQKNQPDRIRELTANGVPASHSNGVNQSALHIAALWAHVECVRVLIQAGANVTAVNTLTGATPLHMAVQSNKAQKPEDVLHVVDLLLEAGADVNQTDSFGNTAYDTAQQNSRLNADVLRRVQPQAEPIFEALATRDMKTVQQLLQNKDTINATLRGRTLVQVCVSNLLEALEKAHMDQAIQYQSLLYLLLEAGASTMPDRNPSTINCAEEPDVPPVYSICTALRAAYKQDNNPKTIQLLEETVLRLVEAGATLPPQLLHDAARRNEICLVQFLLDKLKVDVNAPGRQGMTPLQFAARSGALDVLALLLDVPTIDLHATDERGQTALQAAQVNGKDQAVALLQAKLKETDE